MTKINEVFSATVRDISSEGNGVVEHPSGKTFFVPGVWVDEAGKFKITGFKSRYGFAEIVELDKKSPARVEPPCEHHGFAKGQCGGCAWQFVEYADQLKIKQQKIERDLFRLEENIAQKIKPIWGSPDIFGYRNRAQFKTDGQRIGYVSSASREIAPIDDCLILNEKNRQTLQQLLETLPRKDFKPVGKKRRNKNQWNTLDVDDQLSVNEVGINKRRPFRQGNSAQNKNMQQWLSEQLLNLMPTKNPAAQVVELFSGSGNFTKIIAAAGFKNILAVEGSQEALNELQGKNISGVETLVSNLFLAESVESIFWRKPDTEVLVLDPPRDGLKGREGLFARPSKLSDIFYISCNPATFARDVDYFYQQGFQLQQVQPLDQFPHTPHIELMAHLKKLSKG